ncbi:hypothetical protein H8R17_17720 [Streptomyces sp. TRM68367]|nr:hypothetical protein [Streptomyces sp. TRM68367]
MTPYLDERQRRMLYAAEARQLGHGGLAAVARAAGVSKGCVSRGLAELDAGRPPDRRVRWPGAGRPALAKKDPGLLPDLLALVEDTTQGDPIGPLTWTTKSLRRLADELAAQGRKAGRDTVAARYGNRPKQTRRRGSAEDGAVAMPWKPGRPMATSPAPAEKLIRPGGGWCTDGVERGRLGGCSGHLVSAPAG